MFAVDTQIYVVKHPALTWSAALGLYDAALADAVCFPISSLCFSTAAVQDLFTENEGPHPERGLRALFTETKVESGTSQSKSGTSGNLSKSREPADRVVNTRICVVKGQKFV